MASREKMKDDENGRKTSASPAQQQIGANLILPYLSKYSDITTLVDYLRKKPLGATEAEIKTALSTDVLDWRKVEACKLTGFFDFNGAIKLSPSGAEFSQSDQDGKRKMLWRILKVVRPYNGVLEWAYFQKKDQFDAQGIRLKWSTDYPEIDKTNKQRFDLAPIFFFSLCEGAGLGRFVIGRKGQPTRLEIDQAVLDGYVSHMADAGVERQPIQASSTPGQPLTETAAPLASGETKETLSKRVFVSHGKNRGPLSDVEEMLKIMGLEPKVAIREANLARPVSEKVRTTMKECSGAVFIFTPDETLTDEQGKRVYKPSENVLHELGAASVVYDDRVVILKERSIQLPSNISGLAHIGFDMENVKATFMDLYKELKAFRLL